MNTKSSPVKIIILVAVLVVGLIAVYFSLNKTLKINPESLSQIGTSTAMNSTSTVGLPDNSVPKSGKPVIVKLDIPQGLTVNQKGTWKMYASSTDGGELTYSATWGDEVNADPNNPVIPTKTTNPTFTHAYAYAGTYNPVITAYAKDGQSVYASLGVKVTGDNSKKTPIVYSLSPNSATAGTLITINGAGFTAPKPIPNGPGTVPSNEVVFNGTNLGGVTSNGANSLFFIIPDTAKPGTYSVEVKNSNGNSNTVKLTVTK